MIVKLDSYYNDVVIDYLEGERDLNMFITGDIERYGYDNYFFDIWGDIDKYGNINGILVRYFTYLTFYSKGKFNISEFARKINSINYIELSGKEESLKLLYPHLKLKQIRNVTFCSLDKIKKEYSVCNNNDIKKIKFGNLNKVVRLYREIEEFENIDIKNIKDNLKTGRGYCIEKDKKVIAMAKSTNESSTHAMIVGVATHPNYRGNGFATQCVVKICKELLEEEKKPCLFYDNIDAGRIYEKIGFEKIGEWSIYYAAN